MTDFSFEGVNRSVLNGATTFFKSLDQNDQFLENRGSLKISLLHCYEVLWIHNIDEICNTNRPHCQERRVIPSKAINYEDRPQLLLICLNEEI